MSCVSDQARLREFACELAWWAHSHARGPCVEKYHASTMPGKSKGLRPWEGMEDRPLSRFLSFDTCAYVCVLYAIACILMCDYMLNPNSGATYWVFYIILKPHATHIFRLGQGPLVRLTVNAAKAMEVLRRICSVVGVLFWLSRMIVIAIISSSYLLIISRLGCCYCFPPSMNYLY